MKESNYKILINVLIGFGLIMGISAVAIGASALITSKEIDTKNNYFNTTLELLKNDYSKMSSLQMSNQNDIQSFKSNLSSLQTNTSNFKQQISVSNVPVGSVLLFPLVTNVDQYLPFVPCDGRQLSINEYPDLFKNLGTKYNMPTTNSESYFNIPNINVSQSDVSNAVKSLPSLTLFSPQTSVVFNTQKGPLPLTGNFTTNGGDVVLTLHSTFLSSTGNNTATGLNVSVDGTLVGTIRLSINPSSIHLPSSNTLFLSKLVAGSHTLKLEVIPSSNTTTDVNDYFTAVCTEMVPNTLTPPNTSDVYKSMFYLNDLGFFIKSK